MSFLIREISNLSPFKIRLLLQIAQRPITRNTLMVKHNLARTTAFDLLRNLESRNLLTSSKLTTKVRGKPASIYKLSELGYIFIKLIKLEKVKEPIKKKVPKKPTIKKRFQFEWIDKLSQSDLNKQIGATKQAIKILQNELKKSNDYCDTGYKQVKETLGVKIANKRKTQAIKSIKQCHIKIKEKNEILYQLSQRKIQYEKKRGKKKIPKKPTIKPTKTQTEKDKIARKIIGYSIRELKAYCKDHKIKGYSKLRKNQLRTLIVERS